MFEIFRRINKGFTLQLWLSVILIMISTMNYGFDNNSFNSTQAMNPWLQQFGTYDPPTKTYILPGYVSSLFNSLVYVGFATGVFIGSVVSARYGRRMTMFIQSCYALITASIIVSSKTLPQLMVGRILNYLYVGMELSVVPVFQSEIVPANLRGFTVSTYQLMLAFGGVVSLSICRGTSDLTTNASWQIPYALFFLIPTIIIILIWFIPESPRWLLTKGREEDALKSLNRLHGAHENYNAEEELKLLKIALEEEIEQGSYKELFQGTNLKRTMIVIGSNFFLQATGQGFVSPYGTTFVKQLGTINPFTVSCTTSLAGFVGVFLSLFLADKVGRRNLLLFGNVLLTCALMIMGGLGVQTPVSAQNKLGIVSMLYIWLFAFSLSPAPLNYVITTEMPNIRNRDKNQRVASWVNIFVNFVVAFTFPYLENVPYANLQSKVGFIYGAFSFLSIFYAYFCVPECKNRSLEEIDEMFRLGVPIRKFATYQSTGAGALISQMETYRVPVDKIIAEEKVLQDAPRAQEITV